MGVSVKKNSAIVYRPKHKTYYGLTGALPIVVVTFGFIGQTSEEAMKLMFYGLFVSMEDRGAMMTIPEGWHFFEGEMDKKVLYHSFDRLFGGVDLEQLYMKLYQL